MCVPTKQEESSSSTRDRLCFWCGTFVCKCPEQSHSAAHGMGVGDTSCLLYQSREGNQHGKMQTTTWRGGCRGSSSTTMLSHQREGEVIGRARETRHKTLGYMCLQQKVCVKRKECSQQMESRQTQDLCHHQGKEVAVFWGPWSSRGVTKVVSANSPARERRRRTARCFCPLALSAHSLPKGLSQMQQALVALVGLHGCEKSLVLVPYSRTLAQQRTDCRRRAGASKSR